MLLVPDAINDVARRLVIVELAGDKGNHSLHRTAVRHGTEEGSVTLRGRRVPVQRPAGPHRGPNGGALVLTYELFASMDLLSGRHGALHWWACP